LLHVLLLADLRDLAGIRVDVNQRETREPVLAVALRDRQRNDPERPRVDPLAQEPDLGVLGLEVDLLLRCCDRLLLGDPDLVLLAAAGDEEGE
jgi:hypothetical protein